MADLKEKATVAMDLFTGKAKEVDRKAFEGGGTNEVEPFVHELDS